MTPNARLLQKLIRTKLMPQWARASVGFGERQSRTPGAGMEFMDYRLYQPGDDLRRIDPHLYERLGETYVREYEVLRQLPVTILIDASASMTEGLNARYHFASELAAAFAFVGLAGGDVVQLVVCAADRVDWSPRYQGVSGAARAFSWLEGRHHRGGLFSEALADAARELPDGGLVIVLSDWWDETGAALMTMAGKGQELWCVHVLTPEELDPALIGRGEVLLVDAETGEEIDLSLNESMFVRYRTAMLERRDALRAMVLQLQGAYLQAPMEAPLEALFTRDWRRLGLIR